MNNVQQSANQLRWLLFLLLIFSPVIYIALCVHWGPIHFLRLPQAAVIDMNSVNNLSHIVLCLLAALTPATYWLGLLNLHRVAELYSNGHVFSFTACRRIQIAGLWLVLTDFMYMLQTAISSLYLSWIGLLDHQLIIDMKLGTSIVGLFIVLVARVMVKACEIEQEQQFTV